jgi:hypothetical protein
MELKTEQILVSDSYYHQTKNQFSYEAKGHLVIRGIGAFMTYTLIGMVMNPTSSECDEYRYQGNGVNSGVSVVLCQQSENRKHKNEPADKIKIAAKNKSKACSVM